MKITTLLFLLFISHHSFTQKTEAYYDYFWKPCVPENARYYSSVEKTDSGWLRHDFFVKSQKLQMRALYADDSCKVQNGDFIYYHANGFPSSVGRMVNGKQEGVCISFHSNKMMSDSALYHNGQVAGKRLRWHPNGYLSDSISKVNDSMHVQIGWFDDGTPAYGGYLLYGRNDRKWKYFHHNGEVAAAEVYAKGKLISAEYFDEEGKPQTDTSNVNRAAGFKGGEEAWKKYMEKKLFWPHGLQFTVPASVTVGLSFVIDENGKVKDVEVSMPFHESFDNIALKIIHNSPDWQPAISQNRKIKAYRRQPVTFTQEE